MEMKYIYRVDSQKLLVIVWNEDGLYLKRGKPDCKDRGEK